MASVDREEASCCLAGGLCVEGAVVVLSVSLSQSRWLAELQRKQGVDKCGWLKSRCSANNFRCLCWRSDHDRTTVSPRKGLEVYDQSCEFGMVLTHFVFPSLEGADGYDFETLKVDQVYIQAAGG